MLIILNDIEENEQVIDELADKIFVETLFLRDLDKFFKHIIEAVRIDLESSEKKRFVTETKQIDIERMFSDEIDFLLKLNYARGAQQVIKRFVEDPFVNELYSKQEIRRIVDETMSNINGYVVRRTNLVVPEILKTTENNISQAQVFVAKIITDAEISITEAEKNSMIIDNLTDRLENRKEGIAVTETNNIYENSKQILGGYVDEKLSKQGESLDKRWSAFLDHKTRRAHAMAHGQRVPQASLYNVGGEYLMYPTDTSHGASVKNTINCRCESVLTLIRG